MQLRIEEKLLSRGEHKFLEESINASKNMLSLGVFFLFFSKVSPLETRVTWYGSDEFMGTCTTQVYYSFSNGVTCEAQVVQLST